MTALVLYSSKIQGLSTIYIILLHFFLFCSVIFTPTTSPSFDAHSPLSHRERLRICTPLSGTESYRSIISKVMHTLAHPKAKLHPPVFVQ